MTVWWIDLSISSVIACGCTYLCTTVWLDGLIGMAVVGGAAAVAIGSIVGLGIALTRKKK